MFYMMDYSADVKLWILFGICCAILFGILGITTIIEAIAEKKTERKRRRYGKRYTVEIRPWER